MYFHNIYYRRCRANLGTIRPLHSLENISIKLNFHFFSFRGFSAGAPVSSHREFDLLTMHSYLAYKTTMNVLGRDQSKVAIYMN